MTIHDIYGFGEQCPEFLCKYPSKRKPHIYADKPKSQFSLDCNVVGAVNPPKIEKKSYKRGTYKTPPPGEFKLQTHVIGGTSPPLPPCKTIKKRFDAIPGGTGESIYDVMHWN
eukprot:NODE_198_length_13236_cov_1.328385.p10 type:complete len:113 gc:universal NODE_198_length_13236_cov_1.328385:8332-8670(+)